MKKFMIKVLALTMAVAMATSIKPNRAEAGENTDYIKGFIAAGFATGLAVCFLRTVKRGLFEKKVIAVLIPSMCGVGVATNLIGFAQAKTPDGVQAIDLKNTQAYKDLVVQLGPEKADDLLHDLASGVSPEEIAKNYIENDADRAAFAAAINSAQTVAMKQIPVESQALGDGAGLDGHAQTSASGD